MTEFTILYRGVPIGTATTPPRKPEPDEPAWFRFCFLDFRPSAAYEAIAPVLRLASRALANFGYLGPAADPASDEAGRAAYAAAERVWRVVRWDTGSTWSSTRPTRRSRLQSGSIPAERRPTSRQADQTLGA
jgi:hypothetical protein